jgi:hypothetical protein
MDGRLKLYQRNTRSACVLYIPKQYLWDGRTVAEKQLQSVKRITIFVEIWQGYEKH